MPRRPHASDVRTGRGMDGWSCGFASTPVGLVFTKTGFDRIDRIYRMKTERLEIPFNLSILSNSFGLPDRAVRIQCGSRSAMRSCGSHAECRESFLPLVGRFRTEDRKPPGRSECSRLGPCCNGGYSADTGGYPMGPELDIRCRSIGHGLPASGYGTTHESRVQATGQVPRLTGAEPETPGDASQDFVVMILASISIRRRFRPVG